MCMRSASRGERPIARMRVLLCVLPIMFSVCASSALAQSSTPAANPQNPSSLSLQNGLDPSGGAGGVPAAPIASPSVVQGIGTIPSSAKAGTLGSAGRGLPGMPGGPPIKGALGSQDPSSTYMRPSAIGDLICDPLIDGVCD
ncbi:conserved exported hypothetical protein [Nitrospira lenta]|uniref:Uncharacterized protein n=1 Tax=Nitrospira lenta TaxID=1436998 RepID=A0A330L7I1_9BACT|nr:conserved exported hypothetical protein [Nitrospira lenta]